MALEEFLPLFCPAGQMSSAPSVSPPSHLPTADTQDCSKDVFRQGPLDPNLLDEMSRQGRLSFCTFCSFVTSRSCDWLKTPNDSADHEFMHSKCQDITMDMGWPQLPLYASVANKVVCFAVFALHKAHLGFLTARGPEERFMLLREFTIN